MNTIVKRLEELPKFKEYVEKIKNNTPVISISGISGVGKIQYICSSIDMIKRPVCIVTYNEIEARRIIEDLKYFISNEEILYFPKRELVTYDYVAENKDIAFQRQDVLNKIERGKAKIVVTTIEALMQKMVTKEVLYKNKMRLQVGKTYDIDLIKQTLIDLGYEKADLVEGKGLFSTRGDIIDIALSDKEGIRVEFWGDDIDSIRKFNISTQRSLEMINKVEIMPAHEFVLENELNVTIEKIEKEDVKEEIKNQDIELIENGDYISKVEKYFNCFYTKSSNILDYLVKDFLIFIDDSSKIKQRQDSILIDNRNLIKALVEKEKYVPQSIKNIEKVEYTDKDKQIIYLENQEFGTNNIAPVKFNFNYRDLKYYKSEIQILIGDLIKWLNEKKQVIVLAGGQEETDKFVKLLEEKEIPHTNNIDDKNNSVIVLEGKLSSGFECYDSNLIVISGEDLFTSNIKKKRRLSSSFKEGEKIVFSDLKIGDYVVHKTHGIGQFIGVNTLKADGITKDYIKIRYRNDDMLYIPTNDLDSIRKYIGGGENAPKINRLGSKEWENTKSKVKKNLQEVAKELIELYAKRQKIKGFAFSKDTAWQKQFEDSFEYQETEDQLRCIEETKKDMENPRPMDRLLCGDVGYGKTEVAIRAAFKAVMDQKQVAYLVPTTVLANQQYETFKQRMEDFAIRVELLNRFRTKKEQEEIIKKLKLGEIDVVIGTHRLLSKDVEFKDLGLLIIDEEHRFGVKDKEKIKQYKTSVDVLTMTATPIPRTLHMSIVGIRDMSVIYEPPQNRRPVQTYILEYDEEVIKEAITKELERKGQVFYLYNKVEGIEKKSIQIANLVPEAKVAYAHGKMSGKELEDIMMQFINGDINVLICTTILESGIDIPNANTIIVENADKLGLAQLYQIRGRVGRAERQSYAYITYKRDKLLTEVADKRLKTIKEFTEFGSGFKIAMRDLEIRGAGSMLGEMQSGHMEQVGYDTYCKLLDEVIKEMQGVEIEEEQDVQIDLSFSSYIPDEYIEEGSQKIEIYQNIALCRTEEDLQNITDEIIDRFGTMPKEVENLIEIARIKNIARESNVLKISSKRDGIVFLYDNSKFEIELVDRLLKKYNRRVRFSPGIEPYITLILDGKTELEKLKEIEEFLKESK